MRNQIRIFGAVLAVAMAFLLVGWGNTGGQQENNERTVIAGDTITAGNVVSFDNDYNSYITPLGQYDTGAWVIRSNDENDSFVAGIAIWSATPGQTVRIVTSGYVLAKVDGSDSTISQIAKDGRLSVADRDGYLGSVYADSNATTVTVNTARELFQLNPVAYLVAPTVAGDDTGAITTYLIMFDGLR